MVNYQLFYDGSWQNPISNEFYEVISPITGETVSKAAYGNEADTRKAIDSAVGAFKEWAAMPARERAEIMTRTYQLMIENLDDLAQTISIEMGKPISEARGEAKIAAEYLLWNAEEAKRIYGETIPASTRSKRLTVIRQPVGPVAAILPWNFPLSMVTRKVGPALAAGCTVVVKPASQTPGSAAKFIRLLDDAGMPKGVANLVMGNTSQIVDTMLFDKRIKKITFTGSTEVGKLLLRKAADGVKRVSMELGGHAPFIVFEDADLEVAAEGVIASKFRNTGQTCVCANRVYVQNSIKEEFLRILKEKVEALKIGNCLDEETQISALVNKAAVKKVQLHVYDALQKGALLVTGGERYDVPDFDKGNFYKPTILADVNEDMLITYEETFGPVAPVIGFDTEKEVIEKANNTSYGLAAYFFTKDLARSYRVSEALEYGIVGINDPVPTTVQAPFGGAKESGMGREGGHHGLEEFLETKFISTGLY